MKQHWQKMVAMGLALSTWATPALAGGYCDSKTACKSANDTCLGSSCVPTAKLCTGDSACQGWEKCDFTCPGGISGSSSTGSGGGTTTVSDASVSSSDGGSWGSADAGSTGTGSIDAGSGFQSPPDAASVPAQPDADFGWDASPDPMDVDWQQPNCPKDKGVCVAVLSKVPTQNGCEDFCKVLVPCNLSFGTGSSSSSGGSTGSGGGGVPPQPADAGSSDPSYPDAGFDQAPDAAMAGDAFMSYDTNMPQYDGGPIDPGPDAQAQCVALCSVWVLDAAAPAELPVLEQCVQTQGANGCSAIEKNCEAAAKAFMAAAEANDAWSLGLGGFSTSASGSDGGATKGGDASPVFESADSGAGGSLSLDAVGGDSASSSNASDTGSSTKSGCTAGTSSQTAPLSLALLGFVASAFILRRRRA